MQPIDRGSMCALQHRLAFTLAIDFQLRGFSAHGTDAKNFLEKWEDHRLTILSMPERANHENPTLYQEALQRARKEINTYGKGFRHLTPLYGTPGLPSQENSLGVRHGGTRPNLSTDHQRDPHQGDGPKTDPH